MVPVHGALNARDKFLTLMVMQTLAVSCLSGYILGYAVGFVAPYSTFVKVGSNCSMCSTTECCDSMPYDTCVWETVNESDDTEWMCKFTKTVTCRVLSVEECAANDYHSGACQWSDTDNTCQQFSFGYTSVQTGIFASAMIVGATISSIGAGWFAKTVGHKRTFITCGSVAMWSSVVTHIAAQTGNYYVLVVSRLLLGLTCGVVAVAAPMYVEEMAPPKHRGVLSVFFQISTTLGILSSATAGLLLVPTSHTQNTYFLYRIHGYLALPSLASLIISFVGVVIPESPEWLRKQGLLCEANLITEDIVGEALNRRSKQSVESENTQLLDGANNAMRSSLLHSTGARRGSVRTYTIGEMAFPFFVAFVLCCAQQLTGINAVMNYAPNMTAAMGFEPLFGNFLIMVVNFITTLGSIPLAARFPLSTMYFVSLIVISCACFVTGIPLMPSLNVDPFVKKLVSTLGMLIYITAFEFGMGSTFWTLTQIIFPPSFQSTGSSITVMTQFVINIVVNFTFPVAVQALSGGSARNQDKGMSEVFLFFGGMGIVTSVFLMRFLRAWTTTATAAAHVTVE